MFIVTVFKCVYTYICVFNQHDFPAPTISRNGTIDPYVWVLGCFSTERMMDPKHGLGEIVFQPAFLSSISTVFSHQN